MNKAYDVAKSRKIANGNVVDCGSFCELLSLQEAICKIKTLAEQSDDGLAQHIINEPNDYFSVDYPITIGDCTYTIVTWPAEGTARLGKHAVGSSLAVENDDVVTIVKCLTPSATNTDSDINVYEVEHTDGHHDVMASDNGSVWLVGDENDANTNKSQFCAIIEANGESVEWDEIEDCDLREWITDRLNESKDL